MKLEPGGRLRRLRELRGIPIGDFAARVGMFKSKVSRIENSQQDIKHDELVLFAEVLKTTVAEILGVEGTVESNSTEAA